MTDALIAGLAQIKAVKVISRTSVMQYKDAKKPLPQIAKELDVEGIVEGSVTRSGDVCGSRPSSSTRARTGTCGRTATSAR